jgi:hypothetical protein
MRENEGFHSGLRCHTSGVLRRSMMTKSESNNKLDKCLKRAYSKVDDQVHARAICFGGGKAMAEGIPHPE